MKKFETIVTGAFMALLVCLIAAPAVSQTVNVTFTVNTSTNLDTLSEGGSAQIRGAILGSANGQTGEGDILPGGGNISWSGASSLVLSNIGGDYWQGTFELLVGDTLTYKYWTGHGAIEDDMGTFPDGGWEGPFNPSQGLERDTRIFIVSDQDTTVATQYYQPGGGNAAKDEFDTPFESKPDSICVTFRVNLGGIIEAGVFDHEANGPVIVRGNDATSGGAISWGDNRAPIAREENSVNNGSFYSGRVYIPKDSVEVGGTQAYKFFIANNGGIDWEGSIGDRLFTYTADLVARCDTTLHWVYFDNKAPTGKVPRSSNVTFRVSTEALETLGLFDRGVGDKIAVIGAAGWDRPDDLIELAFVAALQEWAATEPLTKIPGDNVAYKYFVLFDTSRVDPGSPNFIPNLLIQGVNDEESGEDSGWEEPSVVGGGDRSFSFQDAASQGIPGDFGFDRQFFNSVPANAGIPHGIDVTFNINMAPAMDANSNSNDLFNPATDSVWIRPDGSMLALSQGFRTFGDDVVLLKDGDGDMIYSGVWEISGQAWYQLGFQVAYGNATDGVISNGGGFSRGRRYYQFIHPLTVGPDSDVNGPITTWPTEYSLPVLDWVEENLPVEEPPNLLDTATSVDDDELVPGTFSLGQNYPNPFNPETSIEYRIASAAEVRIQVFNTLGQLVNTLVDEKKVAGNYTITWSGRNGRGDQVSSGLYFLKMVAGDFKQVRKMTLLR